MENGFGGEGGVVGVEHTRAFGKLNLNFPVYFSQIEFV